MKQSHVVKRNYVNLGCGKNYHPEWINIDLVASGTDVISYDLSQGIPLPTNSCDVVYHSHMLEHLRPSDVPSFIQENYRVLKSGGIIRIVVPDLESICRLYLEKLEASVSGDEQSKFDYEWMMIELYDQAVREQSGGRMKEYLQKDHIPNEDFVYARSNEAKRIVASFKQYNNIFKQRILRLTLSNHQFIFSRIQLISIKLYHQIITRFLLGNKAQKALNIGFFRLKGEVHQWMYDRYSLKQVLLNAGFENPIQRTALESYIPNWKYFCLDTFSNEIVRKPGSLFMEAKKSP
jgi:predicted SAM-dependent methyltransferase